MASYEDNKRFRDNVIGDLLDTAIDWIETNMSPDEVFDEDKIIDYVKGSVEIDDVYADTVIIEYITETCTPEEVFSVSDLETWAQENGWVRETDQ